MKKIADDKKYKKRIIDKNIEDYLKVYIPHKEKGKNTLNILHNYYEDYLRVGTCNCLHIVNSYERWHCQDLNIFYIFRSKVYID